MCRRRVPVAPLALSAALLGGCPGGGAVAPPGVMASAPTDGGTPASPASGADATLPFDGAGDGSSSVADAGADVLVRGPAPATPSSAFPFPQNRASAHCTYPSAYQNGDVLGAYAQWKSDTVTSSGAAGFLRVQRPADQGLAVGSTVSEGIGYGMLLAVYMNDQALFDGLWKYEQHWVDGAGLMNWYVLGDGSGLGPNGQGGATDADEDMAFALVMADRQWGGQGSLDKPYATLALSQIQAIWNSEIQDSKLPKPGEWGGWNTVNVSYFAPAYYRVFAKLDPSHGWSTVVSTVYDTIAYAVNAANGTASNGLVPAWCDDSHGSPCKPIDMNIPNDVGYQYDSCRTPFRIGLDWCWNGEPRAQSYVALTSAFFAPIGAASIADTYDIDGAPHPQHPGGHSAAFVGPAAVGAMSSPSYAAFLDSAYAALATRTYLVGGTYYEDSWTAMSLLMMTGSFLDYTAL